MTKTRSKLLKEAYPLLLILSLLVSWKLTAGKAPPPHAPPGSLVAILSR